MSDVANPNEVATYFNNHRDFVQDASFVDRPNYVKDYLEVNERKVRKVLSAAMSMGWVATDVNSVDEESDRFEIVLEQF